jgi:hypothetical protein
MPRNWPKIVGAIPTTRPKDCAAVVAYHVHGDDAGTTGASEMLTKAAGSATEQINCFIVHGFCLFCNGCNSSNAL